MKQRREQWLAGLRLGWALLGLALASLSLVPAPSYLLWQVAVVATEWGHLVALAVLLALFPGRQTTRQGQLAALVSVVAALFALSPLLRASSFVNRLPTELATAFGPVDPQRLPPVLSLAPLFSAGPPAEPAQRLTYATPADNAALVIDFYPAIGRARAPLVVVIHGGSWQGGDSTQLAAFNTVLAREGYAVAAITYRLAPQWQFPAAADDVRAALAFLRSRADELGIDPAQIALLGRSAGGQLAALIAAAGDEPGVRGAVAFYAPHDMEYGYANPANPNVIDSRGVLEAYLGGTPQSAAAAYQAASPEALVGPQSAPMLLIHGTRDELVRIAQSRQMAAALTAAGRPNYLLEPGWATHGADFNLNGPFGQLSSYAILHFFAQLFPAPPTN